MIKTIINNVKEDIIPIGTIIEVYLDDQILYLMLTIDEDGYIKLLDLDRGFIYKTQSYRHNDVNAYHDISKGIVESMIEDICKTPTIPLEINSIYYIRKYDIEISEKK